MIDERIAELEADNAALALAWQDDIMLLLATSRERDELKQRVEQLELVLAYIADAWEPYATIDDLQDIAANATAGIYPWSHSTEREAR
jgi:hypothetical protein